MIRSDIRADYGVDAPPVVRNLALCGLAGVVIAAVAHHVVLPLHPVAGAVIFGWTFYPGASMLFSAFLMVLSSRIGKLRERERLIDSLELLGDEIVLDVGCGRGLLLVGAARHILGGRAIGVDLWQSRDQSGNSPSAVRSNAHAEATSERIDLTTADMRSLPFIDGSADLVLSSLAIHNIPDLSGRDEAIREIARVLKPGGRLVLLDIAHTRDYTRLLESLGWIDVARTRLLFRMFPPFRIVTGRKPAAGEPKSPVDPADLAHTITTEETPASV
ncbi:MAG: class I SAM-dependent methyltransferase [Thermoanaerobaculia bacterium]